MVDVADARFTVDAYVHDGTRLLRVLEVDDDKRHESWRLWVEDSHSVWHEQSHSWHFRRTWLTRDEAEACELVRAAPIAT